MKQNPKIACGASYTTTFYAVFESDTIKKLPTTENLVSSIRWASFSGFDAVELEIFSSDHIRAFQNENLVALKSTTQEYKINISDLYIRFVTDAFPRKEDLRRLKERFTQCVHIGKDLGSTLVVIHSPPYPNTFPSSRSFYPTGPPQNTVFTREGEWNPTWQSLVSWIGSLTDIARDNGLKLAIEPRPREMISNTDSMLMLLNDVRSSSLGVLFDTSHHFVMKESLPISVWKLGKSIFAVHLCDNDGVIDQYWAPGEGKIEWLPVLDAFLSEDYGGYLIIEASGLDRSAHDYVDAKGRVENWLGQLEHDRKRE